jgi:hypothetical protein
MYCAGRTAVKRAAGCSPVARSSFLLIVATIGLWLSGPRAAVAQCPPLESAAALSNPPEAGSGKATSPAAAGSHSPFECRFDAALTRMFTPRAAPQGTYRVYVTTVRIEQLLDAFRAVASSSAVEGAWAIQQMDPLDAYGEAGVYDRAKVARLYVGVRARVARGPIIEQGRTVASITLVSPYPDGSLTRLEPGTLIIEFRIPPGTR